MAECLSEEWGVWGGGRGGWGRWA